jgi:hypothetical protein
VAIGKRLADPIRVVSITCDTAIDREATPLLDYQLTRDEGMVRALPGERLTWFTLRPLRGDLVASIRGYERPLACRLAFSASCIACSDPTVLPPEAWTQDGAARTLRHDALDEMPDQLWEELGAVALQLGGLTRGEKRRFELPRGLRVIQRPAAATTAPSADDSTPDPRGE